MQTQNWQLRQKQAQPLEIKIKMSLARIRDFYTYYGGRVYAAISGGMDSTVMIDLIRSIYPDIKGVCVAAQLYPEIYQHVKTIENVEIIRPEYTFKSVCEKYGYPVVSKRMSQYIGEVQRAKGETATKRLRLTGINSNGGFTRMGMISKKWRYLCDAPFSISDRCCHYLKKKPMVQAEKKYGWPFLGIRVSESQQREQTYYKYGCNAFNTKRPRSWPLALWTDADIWQYVAMLDVPYSKLYDMGYTRSGCMFCMLGADLESEPNRFQRMKLTHPKAWDVAINRLGLGEILDYIGVNYEPPGIGYLPGFAPGARDPRRGSTLGRI